MERRRTPEKMSLFGSVFLPKVSSSTSKEPRGISNTTMDNKQPGYSVKTSAEKARVRVRDRGGLPLVQAEASVPSGQKPEQRTWADRTDEGIMPSLTRGEMSGKLRRTVSLSCGEDDYVMKHHSQRMDKLRQSLGGADPLPTRRSLHHKSRSTVKNPLFPDISNPERRESFRMITERGSVSGESSPVSGSNRRMRPSICMSRRRSRWLTNRGFFRDLKKICKFFTIIIGLWKKHAMKVNEFMETSVQLVDFEIVNDVMFDVTEYKADQQFDERPCVMWYLCVKSRISKGVREILLKKPGFRTKDEVRYVEVALRNYPEIAAYPSRIQTLIAERCWYERYVGRRIIIRQGHVARCFYFILSGSVLVTRMEPDSRMSRTLCYLHRGDSFGEMGIRNHQPRNATCISEGSLELLVFGDEEYEMLFMDGGLKDPNDPYLQCISCLQGWPLEVLANNSQKAVSSFFRRGTTLVRNSATSNWVYVIKSGSCTVLKKLKPVQPTKRTRKTKRKRKRRRKPTSHSENPTTDVDTNTEECLDDVFSDISHESPPASPHREVALVTELQHPYNVASRRQSVDVRKEEPPKKEPTFRDNFMKNILEGEDEVPLENGGSSPDVEGVFVRVQILTKGDVFGLADILHEDQPSFSLVSNGAECIMIDKDFYIQHLSVDLSTRLRHEISPYPTGETIQKNLEIQMNWNREKSNILKRTLALLKRERINRRAISNIPV